MMMIKMMTIDADDADDDHEDNDTPVYSVGIDNGFEHDSFLETIVGLVDSYHSQ